jgi:release factor glutamine methyltransferase
MNLKQLTRYFIDEITPVYEEGEAASLFYTAAAHLEGWNRGYVLLNGESDINPVTEKRFNELILELKAGKPLQYIFAETFFYGLKFHVSPAVLIPRPETEELVEWILETAGAGKSLIKTILDIGTGSGCIAVTLKKHLPETQVTAMDIAAPALVVAKENARANGVEVSFIQEDILLYKGLNNYDLIVSNPPYIKEEERSEMHENVLNFEPHQALFVNNEEPLIFYKAIADYALLCLNKEGLLFFEINAALGGETVSMLKSKGFNSIVLKKDMQGKDRMICCRR